MNSFKDIAYQILEEAGTAARQGDYEDNFEAGMAENIVSW